MAVIIHLPGATSVAPNKSSEVKRKKKPRKLPKFEADRHFWPKVDTSAGPEACHPWRGRIDQGNGYGRLFDVQGVPYVHRMAWQIANGRKPPTKGKRRYVLHARGCCKTCCNPDHLRLGTASDNAADAKAEGRMRGRMKVEEVLRVVAMRFAQRLSYTEIAQNMDLSNRSVVDICRGRTWGQVTGIPCSGKARGRLSASFLAAA